MLERQHLFLQPRSLRIEDAGSQERIIPFRDKSSCQLSLQRGGWILIGCTWDLPQPTSKSLLTSSSGRVKPPELRSCVWSFEKVSVEISWIQPEKACLHLHVCSFDKASWEARMKNTSDTEMEKENKLCNPLCIEVGQPTEELTKLSKLQRNLFDPFFLWWYTYSERVTKRFMIITSLGHPCPTLSHCRNPVSNLCPTLSKLIN